jgi:hypothetical protein
MVEPEPKPEAFYASRVRFDQTDEDAPSWSTAGSVCRRPPGFSIKAIDARIQARRISRATWSRPSSSPARAAARRRVRARRHPSSPVTG